MPYRLEICPSNRAKCQGPVCNKNDTKISKGDVRLGVLVEFGEHQSFKWRHVWCITKRQLEGIVSNRVSSMLVTTVDLD
jgi:hypothetical protein